MLKIILLLIAATAVAAQAAFIHTFSSDALGRRQLDSIWAGMGVDRTDWSLRVFALMDSGIIWLLPSVCFCVWVWAAVRPKAAPAVWAAAAALAGIAALAASVYWPSMIVMG